MWYLSLGVGVVILVFVFVGMDIKRTVPLWFVAIAACVIGAIWPVYMAIELFLFFRAGARRKANDSEMPM